MNTMGSVANFPHVKMTLSGVIQSEAGSTFFYVQFLLHGETPWILSRTCILSVAKSGQAMGMSYFVTHDHKHAYVGNFPPTVIPPIGC
jgi:hypothetical protein